MVEKKEDLRPDGSSKTQSVTTNLLVEYLGRIMPGLSNWTLIVPSTIYLRTKDQDKATRTVDFFNK